MSRFVRRGPRDVKAFRMGGGDPMPAWVKNATHDVASVLCWDYVERMDRMKWWIVVEDERWSFHSPQSFDAMYEPA